MLMLLVQGPRLENHCSRESPCLQGYAEGSGRLTMATQALKILAAVSKLWAAGITVAWVVLVEGLQAAALAGVGCQVQAASRGALRLLFQLQEWLWFYGILFSCRSEK